MAMYLHDFNVEFHLNGKKRRFTIYSNMPLKQREGAVAAWIAITKKYTDVDLAAYIMNNGFMAYTVPEMKHIHASATYLQQADQGVPIHIVVANMLEAKGMLDRIDEIVEGFFESHFTSTEEDFDKFIPIADNFALFVDYLSPYPYIK